MQTDNNKEQWPCSHCTAVLCRKSSLRRHEILTHKWDPRSNTTASDEVIEQMRPKKVSKDIVAAALTAAGIGLELSVHQCGVSAPSSGRNYHLCCWTRDITDYTDPTISNCNWSTRSNRQDAHQTKESPGKTETCFWNRSPMPKTTKWQNPSTWGSRQI